MPMSESEKIIRALYEITSEYEEGFRHQVLRLLQLGCERFNLDIGILSRIEGDDYEVLYNISPAEMGLKDGAMFQLSRTYCAVTVQANGPVGFEHVKYSELNTHPAYIDLALESYIGTPVHVDGKIFGTFNFSSPRPYPRKFRKVDLDAMQLMASWLGTEISRRENETKLQEANRRLYSLSVTDGLTKIANRRAFQNELCRLIHAAKRGKQPLSLLILDIDNFKQYNDDYGHLNGDDVLVSVAELLVNSSRGSDLAARFGGEEFAIILPDTTQEGALYFAEKLRRVFETNAWPKRKVTASFGLSTIGLVEAPNEDIILLCTGMINEADKALYHSKEHGRNCSAHYNNIREERL